MKKRSLYLILPVITLILEILPYGAVCNFAAPEGEALRQTFSYFDPTPFGYANFAPFVTALLSCLIFVLIAIYAVKGYARTALLAKSFLLVATVLSLCPLAFGIAYFSAVGGLITLSLSAELLLLQFTVKNSCSSADL